MPVQALFLDEVHCVESLRYAWAQDGTVLLTLDCSHPSELPLDCMTYADLMRDIGSLCSWQQSVPVMIGTPHALAEILTMYHAFECAPAPHHTLMLVSTPPDEYFEFAA